MRKDGFFPVVMIHRDDLVQCGFTQEQADSFTNTEMRNLADKMSDDYLNQMYWESMKAIAEYIVGERA